MDERTDKGWALARSRMGTLFTSILTALLIWLYASNLENPLEVREFGERIPLVVRGLDASLQPLQDLSKETVRVTVRAPRNAWRDLTVDDFTAYIDLSQLGVGVQTVPINVDVSDPQATIVAVQQQSLRLQLDEVKSKLVPVESEIMDGVAYGYDAKPPIYTPISVTVNGPATQVDLVTAAWTPIYLRFAKSQMEQHQSLQAVNRQKQPIQGVTITPNEATIVIPVEQWPGRKEVAVRLNWVGKPNDSYRLSTVKVEPATVVVQGSNELVSAVPGFIETEPLTITDATSEIRQRINLVVPNGLTVIDGNSVLATVSIAPLEDSRTFRLKPIPQNLGPELSAKVSLDFVDVILSGPVPMLDALSPDDVFATLDLTGLVAGSHTLEPKVILSGELREEGVLPPTVEVVISDVISPTLVLSDTQPITTSSVISKTGTITP